MPPDFGFCKKPPLHFIQRARGYRTVTGIWSQFIGWSVALERFPDRRGAFLAGLEPHVFLFEADDDQFFASDPDTEYTSVLRLENVAGHCMVLQTMILQLRYFGGIHSDGLTEDRDAVLRIVYPSIKVEAGIPSIRADEYIRSITVEYTSVTQRS